MATDTSPPHSHDRTSTDTDRINRYASCLITPMSDDDRQIHAAHVIDAVLVGLLFFFATILGDVLPALLTGQGAYLTVEEIMLRLPTAGIAFGLTFVFQWLRARGVDILAAYRKFKENLP